MRITGGVHRSRTLRAPAGQATRPTSDRVREALFGILASAGAIEGARVLDLYAGTGALGLEALSRGAEDATFVESSRDALAAIRSNIEALGVGGAARVVAGDAARAVERMAGPDGTGTAAAARPTGASPGHFDLVFADPPWAIVDAGGPARVLGALVQCGRLAPDAWVILEHAARSASPDVPGLTRTSTRMYGDTALAFYKPAILGPPRTAVPAGTPSD